MVDKAVLDDTRKINKPGNREALALWYKASLDNVRSEDSPDLSNRQMVLLLTIATERGPHTVRGLSEHLNISKPAICRALDSLSRLEMAQRVVDQKDRRNVFVMPTENGIRYLGRLSDTIMNTMLELQ